MGKTAEYKGCLKWASNTTNFWREWKGSLKSSCPHWLKMVTMTLLTTKTGKSFYCLQCNKNSLEYLG